MRKMYKVLLIILIIIVSLILLGYLFIHLYKQFGATISKNDKEEYAKRSEIFQNGEFKNPGNFNVLSSYSDSYKDRTDNKSRIPTDNLPYQKYQYQKGNSEDVMISWLGHSSVLIQMHNMNILVDPIFDKAASPVSFMGPKRYSEVPVSIKDLPTIDIVLITHNHYDHLSYKTIKDLDSKVKKYIVPLGIDKNLEKFGVNKSKIKNMAWWEETDINGLLVACTPSRHYSGRYIFDKNKSLWSSWILKDEKNTVFDSGDSGYSDHFKQIKEKYGDISLAILDGSQYSESWHDIHMFPEETAQAALDLNAKVTFLDHYGAYCISNHSWDDPINRFSIAVQENGINIITPILGETANLKEYNKYQNTWWKDVE